MRKIALLLLGGFMLAFPAFSQSYFSGGYTPWGQAPTENKHSIKLIEVSFKDVTITGHKATLAVAKTIEDGKKSYDVSFFATDDILIYSGGYIRINDYMITEYEYNYVVDLYYIDNVAHYITRYDYFHGDEGEVLVYDSTDGHAVFDVNK